MIPHYIVLPAAEASRIMSGCFGDREFKSRHLGEIPSSDVAKQLNRGDITVRPRCGSDCFCSVGQVHFPKQGNGRLRRAHRSRRRVDVHGDRGNWCAPAGDNRYGFARGCFPWDEVVNPAGRSRANRDARRSMPSLSKMGTCIIRDPVRAPPCRLAIDSRPLLAAALPSSAPRPICSGSWRQKDARVRKGPPRQPASQVASQLPDPATPAAKSHVGVCRGCGTQAQHHGDNMPWIV
jgi:hypothetical protein